MAHTWVCTAPTREQYEAELAQQISELQLREAALLALAREKLGYSAASVEEAIEWAGESITGLMETVKARDAELKRTQEERDTWIQVQGRLAQQVCDMQLEIAEKDAEIAELRQ